MKKIIGTWDFSIFEQFVDTAQRACSLLSKRVEPVLQDIAEGLTAYIAIY